MNRYSCFVMSVITLAAIMMSHGRGEPWTVGGQLLSLPPSWNTPLGVGSLTKGPASSNLWPTLPLSWKLELLQRLSEMEKRALRPNTFLGTRGKKNPTGFVGMRGKKDMIVDEETNEDYIEFVENDQMNRAKKPSAGQFLGMRGKKIPSGFVGMRGKKADDSSSNQPAPWTRDDEADDTDSTVEHS